MSDPVGVAVLARALEEQPTVAARVEVLYKQHRGLVYRLALRYGGGNSAWAEDVTQEVFLRLFDVVGSLDERDGFEAWLYRVTSNRCLNRLRAEQLRNSAPVRWLLGRRVVPADDIERLTSVRQELRRAWDALQQLPPKERIAFSMHYLDGKPQTEIASVLGHSKGYVSKLIGRAEDRVRAQGWEIERG